MEDMFGPIGFIETDHGKLEFGNVGISNCVYLRYQDLKGGFSPCLVYNPEELRDLIALTSQAMEMIASLEESSARSLGVMRPKPATLRVAVVRPPGEPALMRLRIILIRERINIFVDPVHFIGLLKIGLVDGDPPLEGKVIIRAQGRWHLNGKELKPDDSSAGLGEYGQYCHPSEVTDGQTLKLWIYRRERVACFQVVQPNQEVASTEHPLGKSADELLLHGQTHRARKAYHDLAQQLLSNKPPNPQWAAKIVIGVLLSEIADGNGASAQQIWLGQSPNPIFQLGIQSVESGMVALDDYLIYQQISAYFHSLNLDLKQAQTAVNGIMESVCQRFRPEQEALRKMALANWYLYLEEIFESDPPADALTAWKKECKGTPVKAQAISFPPPAPWCEPAEMAKTQTQEAPQKSKPSIAKIALALFVFYLLSISLFKAFSAWQSHSHRSLDHKVSLNGISLGSDYSTLKAQPDWTENPYRLDPSHRWLIGPGISIEVDENKRFVRITSDQVEYDGTIIIPKGTSQSTLQSWLGNPAGKGGGGVHIYYVFEDGGERCVLEIIRNTTARYSVKRALNRWQESDTVNLADLKP